MRSAGPQPEFFLDRALGVGFAQALVSDGWSIYRVPDVFPNDAQDVTDDEWIAVGSRNGWAMLTKDQRIRYRAEELEALDGHIFCLANGNLTVAEGVAWFAAARDSIFRAIADSGRGFWKVYDDGRIRRTWP